MKTTLVLGMHRSGTSLVSRLLHSCGCCFGDHLIPPAADNPVGFWEDVDLVKINNAIMGGEEFWSSLFPDLSCARHVQNMGDWYAACQHRGVVAFKDPRLCRTLPGWLSVIDKPRVVFVVRDPRYVIHSLMSRDGIPYAYSCMLWYVHNYEAMASLLSSQLDFMVIDYDALITSPAASLEDLHAFIGLKKPDHKLIDSGLKRSAPVAVEEVGVFLQQALLLYQTIRDKKYNEVADRAAFYTALKHNYGFLDQLVFLERKKASDRDEVNQKLRHQLGILQSQVHALQKNKLDVDGLHKKLSYLTEGVEDVYRINHAILSHTEKTDELLQQQHQSWLDTLYEKAHARSSQLMAASHELTEQRRDVDLAQLLAARCRPMPHAAKKIALTVVTYNSKRWIDGFMASLLAQDYPRAAIELIFVDHGSADGTHAALLAVQARYGAEFSCLQVFSRPNKGFGCGHDFAMRQTAADLVLVSNIDVKFFKDSLTAVVAQAVADQKAGQKVASWELRQFPCEHPKYYDPVTQHTNWSAHACVLIDRAAYQAVGGYDRKIFMYGEDVELSYRFRRQGYGVKYVPRALIFHYTHKDNKQSQYLMYQGTSLANIYIRMKYGVLQDVMRGFLLLFFLCQRGAGFAGSRGLIIKSLPKVAWRLPLFLLGRRPSQAKFPFTGLDYDLTRDGAHRPDLKVVEQPRLTVMTHAAKGQSGMLRQTIASVINQTYGNIEHIIIGSGAAAEQDMMAALHDQQRQSGYSIKYQARPELDVYAARNLAMQASTGCCLAFLDAGNLVFSDHLETLYAALLKNQTDAAYALARNVPTDYSDQEQGCYREQMAVTPSSYDQAFDRAVLEEKNYIATSAMLFKRTLFASQGGFDQGEAQSREWALWKKYAQQHSFFFVRKTTALQRVAVVE